MKTRTHSFVRWMSALLAVVAVSHAHATLITFKGTMSGAAESPPNASPGTGAVEVDIDTLLNTMRVVASFSGLLGTTIASHIHCCTVLPGTGTAIVATTTPSFPGFPLGVTSGTFDMTYDLMSLSSYNPAFVTASGGTAASAETMLTAGMLAGETYFNIHTTVVPGGEIRAFLVQPSAAVPEPWTAALLGLGTVLGIACGRRGRRRPA